MPWGNILKPFIPWVIASIAVAIMIRANNGLREERDLALSNLGKYKAQLTIATSFNDSMVLAVESIKSSVTEEREAYKNSLLLDRQAQEKSSLVVGEIKELLKNESEDNCGSRRLPQSVIDRMWLVYQSGSRVEGNNENSD